MRRGAQGRAQTVGVQGLRHRLHAGDAHRHLHGLLRGGLRGLLQLRAVREAAALARGTSVTTNFSEDQVGERIEAMRRRPQRFRDERVTMAHGAGGKASRALVEGLVVPLLANPALEQLSEQEQRTDLVGAAIVDTDRAVDRRIFRIDHQLEGIAGLRIAPRIGRSKALLPGQVQQVLINNTALYISSLLLFGNGGFEMNIATTTGIVFLLIGLLALISVGLFPAELILQRLLAWQAIVLLVLFIGAQWEGLAVTLLWIAVAVLLFVWGIVNKRSWPRLAAIVLIGITLGKLIIFDSASFSTIQKIISFLVIGVLLLLFSFYYQKFNLIDKEAGGQK